MFIDQIHVSTAKLIGSERPLRSISGACIYGKTSSQERSLDLKITPEFEKTRRRRKIEENT